MGYYTEEEPSLKINNGILILKSALLWLISELRQNNQVENKSDVVLPMSGGVTHLVGHARQWRLLRGGWLMIMAGMEIMEWHQTHGKPWKPCV
jgi:hypothetical protein